MIRYKQIDQYLFMDTLFATKNKGKYIRVFTCMKLFVTDKGFVHVIPMWKQSEVALDLKMFSKEIGAPNAIICDAAREQISQAVRDFCYKIRTSLRVLEEVTPWENRSEIFIGLLKEAVRKELKELDSPIAFWDYCAEYRARVNNLTAHNMFQLEGRNLHFSVTGEDDNISNICQFAWYQWWYYREHTSNFPFTCDIIGRVLVPDKGEGNKMAQWILKANGNVVRRQTPLHLNNAELNSEKEKRKHTIFDECISKLWGTSISPTPTAIDSDNLLDPYKDPDESSRDILEFDDPVDEYTSHLLHQHST